MSRNRHEKGISDVSRTLKLIKQISQMINYKHMRACGLRLPPLALEGCGEVRREIACPCARDAATPLLVVPFPARPFCAFQFHHHHQHQHHHRPPATSLVPTRQHTASTTRSAARSPRFHQYFIDIRLGAPLTRAGDWPWPRISSCKHRRACCCPPRHRECCCIADHVCACCRILSGRDDRSRTPAHHHPDRTLHG